MWVVGSKITLDLVPYDSNAVNGCASLLCCLTCDDSTLSSYTADRVRESGLGSVKRINTNAWSGLNYAGKGVRMTSYYSPRKYWNVKDPKDQEWLRSVTGANPAFLAEFRFVVWSETSGVATGPMICNVTIDFLVELSDPINLVQS